MSKLPLQTYSLCGLSDTPLSRGNFMADYFDIYLEAHKHLKFPHKHFFYHLVYFTKGTGNHSIDFVNFEVEPNQIYFMIPGQVHTWDFQSETTGFIINFLEDYLHPLISNSRFLDQFPFFSGHANEQVITIPAEAGPQLVQIFETIIKERDSQQSLSDDMIRTALIQLFIQVNRQVIKDKKHENNYNSAVLRNFQKLIDLHYKEKKLTKDYAAMLYVTPNHLNALSKDITGRSAGAIIRDRVLLEAKRLLVNAEMNVSQIADELDFGDNSYFSKFFKKYAGVSPEVFRKQVIKS